MMRRRPPIYGTPFYVHCGSSFWKRGWLDILGRFTQDNGDVFDFQGYHPYQWEFDGLVARIRQVW